jgi:glucose-1-phosphate adenylyltransferase
MAKTLCIILGGGAGTRLYPLTKYRAKPAVPLAGKYRLIDVPISNCIHSGLREIFVLTQYLSASLNRHVAQTYTFDMFTDGFVEILAAEQREGGGHWYQGTADAIRQHWNTFDAPGLEYFLVLPGDALYTMDYRPMIQEHIKSGADVTIAVNTVPRDMAHHFGLLALDNEGNITDFREKPKTAEGQKGLEAPPEILAHFGDKFRNQEGNIFLASMGVYIFNRKVLKKYLLETNLDDFGKQIIPDAFENHKCRGHIFPGYWEDIGTIKAFYEAHMGLLLEPPLFKFADPDWSIFTHPRFLPNIYAQTANLENCRIAEGTNLHGCTIRNSIVGLRSQIGDGAVVEDSIIMGCDHFEDHSHKVPMGIGSRSVIKRAIIDKNARIGRGVKILNIDNVMERDADCYTIRDGIVIVPKNVVIPDGMVI